MKSLVRLARFAPLIVLALGVAAGACDAQSLYWLDTRYAAPTLNKSDANGLGGSSVTLVPGTLPEGLTVDASGKLYWVEAAWANAKLNRAAPTLASITPLVTGGSALRGIAVDDPTRLLYWTSSNFVTGSAISRSGVDGSGATTLLTLSAGANPRGIAVDHAAAKLYWADFDLSAIYRSNLDGSSPGVWLTLPPGCGPYGVAIDPVGQFLYWTEYNTGMLRRTPTTGGGISNVQNGLANPTYLALDLAGSRIFWIEGGAGLQRIRRSNANGTSLLTLPPIISTYGGIAFINDPSVSNPPDDLPSEIALDGVWPNPARGPIHVALSFPREEKARLSVMDLQGREVSVLVEGHVPAGRHEWVWSGRTSNGPAPTGIYFVRLAAAGRTWVRRLAVTR